MNSHNALKESLLSDLCTRRARTSSGQFRPISNLVVARRSTQREQERKRQLQKVSESLFELFLDVMFLLGTTEEFVIA